MNRYDGPPDITEEDVFAWADSPEIIEDRKTRALEDEQLQRFGAEVKVTKKAPTPVMDITREIGEKIEKLGIDNPDGVSRWLYRKLPAVLYEDDFAFDDVHYAVYEKMKEKSVSPFVSVSLDKIIKATPQIITHLQREQTMAAYLHLASLGLKENRLYRWATNESLAGEVPSPEQKFALRCLDRLLRERALAQLSMKLPKEAFERDAENALSFEEVAKRSIAVFGRYETTMETANLEEFGCDAKTWGQLMNREIVRAKSFAVPLGAFVLRQTRQA